ncbi:hypothetical protein HPB52_011318 [Rhipicephalus sanguineus]|uniref:Uncharacterized protein n=1 Tax=Rhipicephalus sanguineus TaxID=34632 RepID=A0A9D4PL95_RHISA|nr:hypothetical protein HPB52_011318 [Rhipicephalus sanguineus]
MQLDACLAVNGVTAQPIMHDVLLDAFRLSCVICPPCRPPARSPMTTSALRCWPATARRTARYRGPVSSGFPLRQREWYHPARSPPMTATYLPWLRLFPPLVRLTAQWFPRWTTHPTMFRIPRPRFPRPTTLLLPSTNPPRGAFLRRPLPTVHQGRVVSRRSSPVHDTSLTSASTLATLPHDLEADTDNLTPAVRPSLAEVSPSKVSEHDFSPTSKLCASCQRRPALPSTSTAAEARAPYQLRAHLQDAATTTEAPEDDIPAGSPKAAQ